MTNQEAIELLEEVKIIDDSMFQYIPKYMEALEMAIAVLETSGNSADTDCFADCRWHGRYQKCSCCSRNKNMKDCYETEEP